MGPPIVLLFFCHEVPVCFLKNGIPLSFSLILVTTRLVFVAQMISSFDEMEQNLVVFRHAGSL